MSSQQLVSIVTGAAGFIGSHLCDALLEKGHQVVGIDNFSSGTRNNITAALKHSNFQFHEASILDRELMLKLFAGADNVFHLAVECVRRSIGKPIENHDVNASGTLYCLEAARLAKIHTFIYCSSSEIYGNGSDEILKEDSSLPEPVTVYGAAKLVGEHYSLAYHRTYGLRSIVVRPFNSYGPREHHEGVLAEVLPKFIIRALNGQPPLIYGDGSQSRDFTYISDTVNGIILASQSEQLVGRRVNLAFGRDISIKECASEVIKAVGAKYLQPVYKEARPGDVVKLRADTSLATKILGFKAAVDFETGVKKTVEYFRSIDSPEQLMKDDLEKAWIEV
jgi:UDP-glucose 4-epimerase